MMTAATLMQRFTAVAATVNAANQRKTPTISEERRKSPRLAADGGNRLQGLGTHWEAMGKCLRSDRSRIG